MKLLTFALIGVVGPAMSLAAGQSAVAARSTAAEEQGALPPPPINQSAGRVVRRLLRSLIRTGTKAAASCNVVSQYCVLNSRFKDEAFMLKRETYCLGTCHDRSSVNTNDCAKVHKCKGFPGIKSCAKKDDNFCYQPCAKLGLKYHVPADTEDVSKIKHCNIKPAWNNLPDDDEWKKTFTVKIKDNKDTDLE